MNHLDPLSLILCALATFRLSLLISKESGPMWIFRKLRRAVPAKSSAKEGISCVFCTSLWHAIPVSLYAYNHDSLPGWATAFGDWFILMLALSAGAIIVNQQWTKG